MDVAFNEVQSKVNQALRRLPKDTDPPIVAKVETNASPIIWMALQGDRTQQQLNQYAINVVKKRLETIDGVGEVRLGGRRDRTIRVNLLPDRMAALARIAAGHQHRLRHRARAAGRRLRRRPGHREPGQARPRIPHPRRSRRAGRRPHERRRHPPQGCRRTGRRPHRQPPARPLQWRNDRRPRRGQGRQRQHGRHRRPHQGKAGAGNRAATAARA